MSLISPIGAMKRGIVQRECAVSDDANNKPGPFDVGTIKNLVALMSRHDLSEIDLSVGDQRIRLRRGARVVAAPLTAAPPMAFPTAAPMVTSSPPASTQEQPARKLVEIKSEVIGHFYAKANPESPPFVKIGDKVKPDTVVALIEAMKLYNEVVAGCSGVIAEILAENGQSVDYGQVLFRVDPAG